MKKHLAILFLAAGMLLGGAQQGQAVDFKAKGVWINMLEYGGGGNFVKNDRNGHNVTGWGRWGGRVRGQDTCPPATGGHRLGKPFGDRLF